MQTTFRKAPIAMLCVAIFGNAACTSMARIDATPAALEANDIEPGDRVTLVFNTGFQEDVTIETIDDSGIRGTREDGRPVTAGFGEIWKIEARKFDGRKTAVNAGKGFLYAIVGIAYVGAMTAEALARSYGN